MNALLVFFAILNLLDGWTTWQGLRFGGSEAWFPKYLMNWIGAYPALLLLKVGIVAAVWWATLNGLTWQWLAAFCAGYTLVVVWNYRQLLKLKEQR